MPTEIKGETTKKVKAGKAKGANDGNSYGSSLGCVNSTGVQWKDLHVKIKGLKPGNQPSVQVFATDPKGVRGNSLGAGSGSAPDKDGASEVNIDPITVDANANFEIVVRHNPTKPEKEEEYELVITPTDQEGYPVN